MNTFVLVTIIVGSFIFGVLAGVAMTVALNLRQVVGTLRVDHSDPNEQPYFFLELMNEGYAQIQTKDYVMFRVLRENYIPRE